LGRLGPGLGVRTVDDSAWASGGRIGLAPPGFGGDFAVPEKAATDRLGKLAQPAGVADAQFTDLLDALGVAGERHDVDH
jgi:hypothetical protein